MKTTHLVAAATGLVVLTLAVVLWRQGDITDEMTMLRAQLAALSPPASTVAGPISATEPFVPTEPHVASTGPLTPEEERIAELERVANEQADIIEDLLARLDGMDTSQRKASAPAWSAVQAAGPPDSGAGDQRTAWAPATEDGGVEWLLAEFSRSVEIASVIVRENCAPGAITRISVVTDSGSEVPVWQGEAPKVAAVSSTPFVTSGGGVAKRVKIYLDTKKVPGWNEIDAVQLVGRDGSRQWATGASASSSYGSGSNGLQLGEGTVNYYLDESSNRGLREIAPRGAANTFSGLTFLNGEKPVEQIPPPGSK